MKLWDADLKSLCEMARTAALNAGEFISASVGKNIEVLSKEGGDSLASQVLTEVDLKSQVIILETLAEMTERFELGILCEEGADDGSRFAKEYFWSIDPLDGTLSFTKSVPGYSVSIALLTRSGDPLVGVIYDPFKNNLYHAIKDGGSFRNGEKWPIDSTDKRFTFIHDSSFTHHALYERTVESLKQTVTSQGYELKIVSHGGAAMNALWMMEQSPAVYFKYPKNKNGGGSLWDYAASSLIVSESGGVAGDFFGRPLDLNSSSSLFMNRSGIFYASSEKVKSLIDKGLQSIFNYNFD